MSLCLCDDCIIIPNNFIVAVRWKLPFKYACCTICIQQRYVQKSNIFWKSKPWLYIYIYHSLECNMTMGQESFVAIILMMTPSNGNIFRVHGPLWGEFTGEFTSQRPVARCFDGFFDLRLNKWLSKLSRRRWFEMSSRSLWRHCNVLSQFTLSYEYHSLENTSKIWKKASIEQT